MNAFLMAVIVIGWALLALAIACACVVFALDAITGAVGRWVQGRSTAAYQRGVLQGQQEKEWKAYNDTKQHRAALINENNQLRKALYPGKC